MTATLQTLLLLLAVLVVVALLAQRLKIAPSILLVIAGIGLALVPGLPRIAGGHSLGGQLAGCRIGRSPETYAGLWLAGSGAPYWRAFPRRERLWLQLWLRRLSWLRLQVLLLWWRLLLWLWLRLEQELGGGAASPSQPVWPV